jgi:hypothetical protein
MTDRITDRMTDRMTERMTEKMTDRIADRMTEKITDKVTEKITEKETTYNEQTSIITNRVGNWTAENFFLGLYYYSEDEEKALSKDDIIKYIREDIIKHHLDDLISDVIEEKEDKIIQEENALYQITTSENQNNNKYTNVSSIKLGECEDILKDVYDCKNETLIILKIDYQITGLLIPIIGYEVYHPRNKSKLDLSYCDQSKINYNIPVKIDEDNLFKYNPNSDYYTDECNIYTTENGTDILLNDRKEEFSENNMSLCENLCEYTGYDSENKKALCECGIRYKELYLSELDNDPNLLANDFVMNNETSNIGSLKCYQTLFSKEGLLKNIGSYILLFIIIFHLSSIIFFYKCGKAILENTIQEIIENKEKIEKLEKKEKNSNKNKKNEISSKMNNKMNIKMKISNKKINNSKNRKRQTMNNSIHLSDKKDKKNDNLYSLGKKMGNKRRSCCSTGKKSEKSKIKNKGKSDPPKKTKKRKDKIINQENTNISINAKSFTKMKIKENNKIITKKEKKIVSYSSKILKGNNVIKNKKIVMSIPSFNKKYYKFLNFNDFELNTLEYKEALIIDKRSYWKYYISLIRTKHPIIFTFLSPKDFNITVIKICLLLLSFAINYALNTFFFDFSIIHNIYKDQGEYNFSYLFPITFQAFIISYYITIIVKFLVLSERNILVIKNQKTVKESKDKEQSVERCLIIKNICYFIISVAFLVFFWYYLAAFCAVYQNSQIYVIENTFISFLLTLLFPFITNLIPGIFRLIALKDKKKDSKVLYTISKITQIIL